MRLSTTINMDSTDDRYLSLTELSLYSGLSISTLKRKLGESNGFPYFKTGHRVLVKKSEFDLWMGRNCRATAPEIPPDTIQDMAKDFLNDLGFLKKAA
jgi:predicted DNA-binding transcriptional regulator AlpA